MSADDGIDSSDDAAADADGASVTSVSDALFLLDGADETTGAIMDAADETSVSCEKLLQCCDQLTMTGAPAPVLAACFAQQWDGGDPSACDMVLAGLIGAGICP
jgi:hypothetical protein